MKSVYVDTMIFSFLVYDGVNPKAKTFSDLTKFWFSEHSKNFNLAISEGVLIELRNGHFTHKSKAIEIAEKALILPPTEFIEDLSNYYISEKVMPERGLDSDHLAYASAYAMDYLLSWNYKHLVNPNKFKRIEKINSNFDLKTPEIVDPIVLRGI